MAKFNYFVEVDGQVFTRKSPRTYTHAIVCYYDHVAAIVSVRGSDRADHEKTIKDNFEYFNTERALSFATTQGPEARARVLATQAKTLAQYTEECLQESEMCMGKYYPEAPVCVGWAGSHSLAMKQVAQRTGGKGASRFIKKAIMVPAQIK